eukprot:7379879-Prymnesium_polylepis.1
MSTTRNHDKTCAVQVAVAVVVVMVARAVVAVGLAVAVVVAAILEVVAVVAAFHVASPRHTRSTWRRLDTR